MLGITCDNWFRALSSYTYTTSLWRLTDQEPLTFPGMQSTSISFRPHGFLGMEGAGLRMGNGENDGKCLCFTIGSLFSDHIIPQSWERKPLERHNQSRPSSHQGRCTANETSAASAKDTCPPPRIDLRFSPNVQIPLMCHQNLGTKSTIIYKKFMT